MKPQPLHCHTSSQMFVLCCVAVADASGRYGGSFLWGNTYWVGSAALCGQISHGATKPPFPLGFYILRTHIMLDRRITPQVALSNSR